MPGSHRILIVEDEPDLLRIVEAYLKSCNFEVDSFTNPVQALEHFRKNPSSFSLVLTDVRMPHMTGLELAKSVVAIKPSIKVMLMTAYQIDSLAFQTGLDVIKHDDIITKPFELEQICDVVMKKL